MTKKTIGIIGLGYVGLPLAIEFTKKYSTIGCDISSARIAELNDRLDKTREVSRDDLDNAIQQDGLFFTSGIEDLKDCDVYIVTVPTPIDKFKRPDLSALLSASKSVASVLSCGDIVIYESTVYPGATEDDCVPVLEAVSGLKFNNDFFVGYSPERINPGDKVHTLTKIMKVTSGSTAEAANQINDLYSSIIEAGTFLAPSIKVAEAAKVIENAQRDLNIAFVNELAMIFDRLNINTSDVLDAASTKWNFLPFKPGLVGGHCIGVDPYYLTHKAQSVGYNPEIILAGRRLNDSMSKFVANQFVKLLIKNGCKINGSRVLLLGLSFKENCPDIRNSKAIDVYNELIDFGLQVDVFDPHVDKQEVSNEFGVTILSNNQIPDLDSYEGVMHVVAHDEFAQLRLGLGSRNLVIYDVKGSLDFSHASL